MPYCFIVCYNIAPYTRRKNTVVFTRLGAEDVFFLAIFNSPDHAICNLCYEKHMGQARKRCFTE